MTSNEHEQTHAESFQPFLSVYGRDYGKDSLQENTETTPTRWDFILSRQGDGQTKDYTKCNDCQDRHYLLPPLASGQMRPPMVGPDSQHNRHTRQYSTKGYYAYNYSYQRY